MFDMKWNFLKKHIWNLFLHKCICSSTTLVNCVGETTCKSWSFLVRIRKLPSGKKKATRWGYDYKYWYFISQFISFIIQIIHKTQKEKKKKTHFLITLFSVSFSPLYVPMGSMISSMTIPFRGFSKSLIPEDKDLEDVAVQLNAFALTSIEFKMAPDFSKLTTSPETQLFYAFTKFDFDISELNDKNF